jgi:hypothetical protein
MIGVFALVQSNADWKALHYFDKVPGRVLWRQKLATEPVAPGIFSTYP